MNDLVTHLDRIRRLRLDIMQLVNHAKSPAVRKKWMTHADHLDQLEKEIENGKRK